MGYMVSTILLDQLLRGKYTDKLDFVKKDDTLGIRFRGNSANIFYRGLQLVEMTEESIKYNPTFCKGTYEVKNTDEFFGAIPFLKQNADLSFTRKGTYENEFSQIIERENNSKKFGKTSDYFILEDEYVIDYRDGKPGSSRVDLIGIHLNHSPQNRTQKALTEKVFDISLIEVKYLDDAYVDNQIKDKIFPGISKHIADFARLFDQSNEEVVRNLADDLSNIFSAKRRMGLLPGLSGDVHEIGLSSDPKDLEFLLVLMGHNTNAGRNGSGKDLYSILKENIYEKGYSEEILQRIYIAQTSEFGVGLYDKKLVNIREYVGSLLNEKSN